MSQTASEVPLVSIIVPVYNGSRYLCASLDSILEQHYARIEVLVMDDASTDATPDILAAYGTRIRVCRQPGNRGIYGNANDGIALAQGEFVAIYHADDLYDPRIVEREVEFLIRHPEAGAVFCADIMIDPEGREEGRLVLPPEIRGEKPLPFPVIFNALLKYRNRFLMCPSSMVRASVYRELEGYRDVEFRNTADLDMWLRIARKYPIGVLEEHLFSYRYGHGNSAQRYHGQRIEPERFFRIMDLYLEEGGRAIATSDSLAAYEAHRAEDGLMRTVNAYVLGRMDDVRTIIPQVHVAQILRSPVVERWRLLCLLLVLKVLARLPRISIVARVFAWRWHGTGRRKRGQAESKLKQTSLTAPAEQKVVS